MEEIWGKKLTTRTPLASATQKRICREDREMQIASMPLGCQDVSQAQTEVLGLKSNNRRVRTEFCSNYINVLDTRFVIMPNSDQFSFFRPYW